MLNTAIIALLCFVILITSTTISATTILTPIGIDGTPKDWVFLIKLGKGGDNCEKKNSSPPPSSSPTSATTGTTALPSLGYEDYECGVLYADSDNQTLQSIPGTIHDPSGPLYQTWSRGALNPDNAYTIWNDQSGPTKVPPFGNGIAAHDKGFLLYNNISGILGQHSCPNWLYSPSNHFRSPETFYNVSRPGMSLYLFVLFLFPLYITLLLCSSRSLTFFVFDLSLSLSSSQVVMHPLIHKHFY